MLLTWAKADHTKKADTDPQVFQRMQVFSLRTFTYTAQKVTTGVVVVIRKLDLSAMDNANGFSPDADQ